MCGVEAAGVWERPRFRQRVLANVGGQPKVREERPRDSSTHMKMTHRDHHPDIKSSSQAGFSLVELIAVGLAVVILALVCVPRAVGRDRSAGVRCLENQRRLVEAFHAYAEDNNGVMVATVNLLGGDLFGGGFWPGPQPNLSPGITKETAKSRVEAGLRLGPLWRYLPQTAAYHCPDDLRSRLNEPGAGWAYDSYSKADGMNGLLPNGQPPFRTIDTVPEPAFAMAFVEESDPRQYNQGTWVLSTSPYGWVDPVAINHDRGGTFGFVDGHAETRHWRDPRTLDAAETSSQGIQSFFWPGGDLTNPDFRWILRRYKYKGWTVVAD